MSIFTRTRPTVPQSRHAPLTRPRLCDATGYHDPRPDGLCRDCGVLVTDQDPVCGHKDGELP